MTHIIKPFYIPCKTSPFALSCPYGNPVDPTSEATKMNLKALAALALFLASSQALAEKPNLTPEQLAKAREAAAQLNPPVDFDKMLDEVDRLGVECTGDLTRKARIHICGQKIENAQLKEENARLKADTEATQARIDKIDKENAELIREIQQRIKENK